MKSNKIFRQAKKNDLIAICKNKKPNFIFLPHLVPKYKIPQGFESIVSSTIQMIQSPQFYDMFFKKRDNFLLEASLDRFKSTATLFATSILQTLNGNKGSNAFLSSLATILTDEVGLLDQEVRIANRFTFSGIYLLWGLNEAKEVEWIYVGKSRNIQNRLGQHLDCIEEIWPDVEHTTDLKYNLAKKSNTVKFGVLANTSSSDDLDLYNAQLEALYCAMFGSYNKCPKFLELRAEFGLPAINVKGANATRCLDGPDRRVDVCSNLNILIEHWKSKLSSSWLNFIRIDWLWKYHQDCYSKGISIPDNLVGITQNCVNRAKEQVYINRDRYEAVKRDHLLNGEFIMQAKAEKGDHPGFYASNFHGIFIKDSIVETLGIVDLSQVYLHLQRGPSSQEDDLFLNLSEKERHLYSGIKLFATKDGVTVPFQFIIMIDNSITRQKFARKLYDWLAIGDSQTLIREAKAREDRQEFFIPEETENRDIVNGLLNGHARLNWWTNCWNIVWKPDAESNTSSPRDYMTLPDLGDITTGLGYSSRPQGFFIFIRVNFNSEYSVYQYRSLQDGHYLANIGFDVLNANNEWVPLRFVFDLQTSTENSPKGTKMIPILKKARQIYIEQGGEVSDTSAEDIQPIPIDGIPQDLPGTPSMFKIMKNKNLRKEKTNGGYLFNMNANDGLSPKKINFYLAKALEFYFWPNDDRSKKRCAIKLDGWNMEANQARLLVCTSPDGNGPWFDSTSYESFSQQRLDWIDRHNESARR